MRLYGARLKRCPFEHTCVVSGLAGRLRRQGLQRPRFKDRRLLAVHSRARSVRASRPSTHDRLICGRRLMRIKRRASFICRDGCWRKEPLHSDHGAGCVCELRSAPVLRAAGTISGTVVGTIARSVSRDPTTSSVGVRGRGATGPRWLLSSDRRNGPPSDTKTDPSRSGVVRSQREPAAPASAHSDPKLHGLKGDMVSRRSGVLDRAAQPSSSVAIDSSRLGS